MKIRGKKKLRWNNYWKIVPENFGGGTWTKMGPDFQKIDQTNFNLWNGLEST